MAFAADEKDRFPIFGADHIMMLIMRRGENLSFVEVFFQMLKVIFNEK